MPARPVQPVRPAEVQPVRPAEVQPVGPAVQPIDVNATVGVQVGRKNNKGTKRAMS